MKYFNTLLFCLLSILNYGQLDTVTIGTSILVKSEIAIGLNVPWDIEWGPDDHIWATERRGTVVRIDPSSGLTTTVLDIRNKVSAVQESGLLGLAIHPDFDNNPYVYLAYVYGNAYPSWERLVRYTWDGSQLVNEEIVLDNNRIEAGFIHNGSRLMITDDMKILMTTGDFGSSFTSQSLSVLNGKLLRINLDGSIPDDNPDPSSYVYSYGHRNSQGIAYGPNRQIYSSEHGPDSSDEFNLIIPNRNYGWPAVIGACNTGAEINFCNNNDVVEPLIEWTPCVAVNGLSYYDHTAIPELEGKMLMAVLGGFAQLPRVSVLTFNDDGTQVTQEEQYFDEFGRIRDIIVSPEGDIYFATNGNNYPGSGPNMIISYSREGTVSSTNDIVSEEMIALYPNPASEGQAISLSYDKELTGGQYQVIGYDGKVYNQGSLPNDKQSITLKDITSGHYYMSVTSEVGRITKSFVVE